MTNQNPKSGNVIEGMCVSPGEVTGVIRFYKAGDTYTKNDIIVLNEWVTSNVALLKEAGGLISTTGGLTSHASIIAREYRLPGMGGGKGGEALKDGTRVRLDATNEEIHIL